MEQLVTIWQAAMGTNPNDVLGAATVGVDSMLSTLGTSLSWLIPAAPTNHPLPDFALVSLPQGNLLPEIQSLAGNNQNLVDIFQNLTDHFNNGLAGVAAALNATTVFTFNAERYVLLLGHCHLR
jgi:hypothetical protein